MAPINEVTVNITKPFFPTPIMTIAVDTSVTQLRLKLPAGCTAKPAGGLPTALSSDAPGAYTFPIKVPKGDAPGATYNDYGLLLTDENGQSGPGTIRVTPKGRPDDDEMFAADNE